MYRGNGEWRLRERGSWTAGEKYLSSPPCLPFSRSLALPLSRSPAPHLPQLARERIAILPAGSPGEAEILEPPDGDFAEDRVDVHRQTASPGHLGGQERRARMREEIERHVARRRAGLDDSPDRLERLLCVTAVDVLFHPVKDLLHVDPDVARPDEVAPPALRVLGHLPVHLFVISLQRFRNIGVLRRELGGAFRVIEQFLTHAHPVLLRAVAALVAHGDEAARRETALAHHQHHFGERGEAVLLIGADP